MNFRKLIEQAMNEARDEFAEIVTRKLSQLMGDTDTPRAKAVTRRGRPPGRPSAKKLKAKRGRVPADHMTDLRTKILKTLHSGETLKKAQILERAGLKESEATRVGSVLKKLKEDGMLNMYGNKGAASYSLKND